MPAEQLHGQVELLLGHSGSGKTHLLQSRLGQLERIIVWDTKPDGYHAALPAAALYDDVREFLAAVAENGEWGRVVLQAPDWQLETLLEFAYRCGSMAIVIEEIDHWCTSSAAPAWLTEALRRGRSRGLTIICTSQRSAEIPKMLTNRCDAVVLMAGAAREPRDAEYIARRWGQHTLDLLRELEPYTFLRVAS
jgi:energy-coupling factor transporter ATP-binding protein EcfA2